MTPHFTHFAAIDWSGAAGERHRGIAVAMMAADDDAPHLVRPGHVWSRAEVLEWLVHEAPPRTIFGFDLGQSLPFADAGAFFPGWADSPPDARSLWAMVDAICADEPHLGVSSFVDHSEIARHFRRHAGREGDLFGGGRGRFRVTEAAQAAIGCSPTSNFNLVGAAQVGKGSLSGMRLLHRLPREIAVWPMDAITPGAKVVVEIYTTIAAITAGRRARNSKIRDGAALAEALGALGCRPGVMPDMISDHAADALITAAWLRGHAHRAQLWRPAMMNDKIAQTEGWTFGAL
ncbi:hypothetical protein [Novosphingobium sp. KACC 22771]|uniref:hypothetical protein n=1 Tax=Novosphingobium sp. KACC 22771 TaxID=3025670 RepID=UPI002366DF93|nr:hypothetical protein [Novosphingobium sp. KACC 22771]WDF71925.1 hypothetical protein PQ467_14140 [Novosphingobium sp. KACC 22771]